MKPVKRLSATLIFAITAAVLAGPARASSVDELVALNSRPTIEQVAKAIAANPNENPFKDKIFQDSRFHLATTQLPILAKSIALLEFTFPGAIWATLGRDAVIFGDAVDALYSYLGASRRVARLNASGPTIHGATRKELVRFLKDAGMDLENSPRPFVGLDRTQYLPSSQSRKLLTAAYESYKHSGTSPRHLTLKLNFIGLLGLSTPKDSSTALDDTLAYMSNVYDKNELHSILQLIVGNWTDAFAWNNSFGPLVVQPNGKLEGALGTIEGNSEVVIGEMIWILQHVATAEFVQLVSDEAKALGYDFIKQVNEDPRHLMQISIDRASTYEESRVTEFLRTADQELSKILQDKDPSKDVSNQVWHWAILKWNVVKKHGVRPNSLALLIFSRTTTAFDQYQIPINTYLKLIATAISFTNGEDPTLEQLNRVLAAQPTLYRVLLEEEVFFFKNSTYYPMIREKVFKRPVDLASIRSKISRSEESAYRKAVDEHLKELDHLVENWPQIKAQKDPLIEGLGLRLPLTSRVNDLSKWYGQLRSRVSHIGQTEILPADTQGRRDFTEYFLHKVTEAFDQGKLSIWDYLRLLSDRIAQSNGHPDFLGMFEKLCSNHPSLRKVLIEEEVFFATPLFRPFYYLDGTFNFYLRTYRELRKEALHLPIDNAELLKKEIAAIESLQKWHASAESIELHHAQMQSFLTNDRISQQNVTQVSDWVRQLRNDHARYENSILLRYDTLPPGHGLQDKNFISAALLALSAGNKSGKIWDRDLVDGMLHFFMLLQPEKDLREISETIRSDANLLQHLRSPALKEKLAKSENGFWAERNIQELKKLCSEPQSDCENSFK